MPDDDAMSGKHLDCIDGTWAKKSLKAIQLALTFEHQADDGALRCKVACRRHRLGP
jgi:hypothetical protein